jgi:hypothetical protein
MAATSSETLNEIEVFRNNARTTHKAVRLNVEGLTQEDSLAQLTPAGNCLNWVVGHLVCIYDEVRTAVEGLKTE